MANWETLPFMMTIAEVNTMECSDFVKFLGGIYEHSPWVAEAIATRRPHHSLEQLSDQMRRAVEDASPQRQLDLIRAHPDLAGKLAVANQLTEASRSEQSGAGLDRLDPDGFAEFSSLNAAYRERFGFPFIICVRKTDRTGILAAFRERLAHSPEEEHATALEEIHEIARLRLADSISA